MSQNRRTTKHRSIKPWTTLTIAESQDLPLLCKMLARAATDIRHKQRQEYWIPVNEATNKIPGWGLANDKARARPSPGQPTKRCLPKLKLTNQQTHKDRPRLEEICCRVNCNASLNHLLKVLHHLTAATLIGNGHRRFPNHRALEENSHHHQLDRGDNSSISPSINDYRSPILKKNRTTTSGTTMPLISTLR